MAKKKININLLNECEKRFSQKPWYSEERLNALMGRLAYLDADETDLVLDLTDNFQYLKITDCPSMLRAAFKKIPTDTLNDVEGILFTPLKSPYFIEKKYGRRKKNQITESSHNVIAQSAKSCDFIFRLMQIDYPQEYLQYSSKIKMCYTPQDITKYYTKDSLIVLWDDFVGSGDVAFNAIADLQKFLYDEKGIKTLEKNFTIVCMVAMREGIDILDYCMLKCYASNVYFKAISDDQRFNQKQIEARISCMKSAETKVLKKSAQNFSLGYKQSEALVSILDKCPNNTFPFYWFDSSYNNVEPIFYRRK